MLNKFLVWCVTRVLIVYKYAISPFLGDCCRFSPSCSDYSIQALRAHGILHGGVLSLKRVLRCNPYCQGGEDPVPLKKTRTFIVSNFIFSDFEAWKIDVQQ